MGWISVLLGISLFLQSRLGDIVQMLHQPGDSGKSLVCQFPHKTWSPHLVLTFQLCFDQCSMHGDILFLHHYWYTIFESMKTKKKIIFFYRNHVSLLAHFKLIVGSSSVLYKLMSNQVSPKLT